MNLDGDLHSVLTDVRLEEHDIATRPQGQPIIIQRDTLNNIDRSRAPLFVEVHTLVALMRCDNDRVTFAEFCWLTDLIEVVSVDPELLVRNPIPYSEITNDSCSDNSNCETRLGIPEVVDQSLVLILTL